MSTIFPSDPEINDIYDGYIYTGTAWEIIGIDLTADYLTTSTAASTYQAKVTGVSDTEIGYLDGVTSGIQSQLNGKSSTSHDHSGVYQPVVSGVSDTEIGYLDGVTSAIQTQLNAKASLSGATFTGDVTVAKLISSSPGGDEGGEINLVKAATNTTLADGVVIDVNRNKLRIFEQGSPNRGVYIDLANTSNGVGTNITPGLEGVPYRMAAGRTGQISMSTNNGNGWYYGSVAVTFPSNRFSVAPIVTTGSDYSYIPEMCNPMVVTSTGFNMFAVSATSGRSIATHWTAVQMTSGAASG